MVTRWDLAFFTMLLSVEVYAGSNPCTNTLGSLLEQYTGDCLGGGYDSVEITVSKDPFKFRLSQDISASDNPASFYYFWRDISFEGSGGTPYISIVALDSNYQEVSVVRTITTQYLTLDSIHLETDVKWQFSGTDNQISFKNGSTFEVGNASVGFISTAPLTLHSESGDNTIRAWDRDRIGAPTTINVDSASSLTFQYVGDLSQDSQSGFLEFDSSSVANVDGGTLAIDHSRLNLSSGSLNVSNNGSLELSGSSSILKAVDASFENSSGTVGRNTRLLLDNDLTLVDSSIDIQEGGYGSSVRLMIEGSSTISGDDSQARFDTEYLSGASGSSFTLQDINVINTDTLLLADSFDVNVVDGLLRIRGDLILNGGSVSVSSGGQFLVQQEVAGSNGTITVDASKFELLNTGTSLSLTSDIALTLSNSGSLVLSGGAFYSGSHNPSISTDPNSVIYIEGQDGEYQGILSPGDESDSGAGDVIGILSTDAQIYFRNELDAQTAVLSESSAKDLLNTGLFDGGYYQADLRMNGVTPEADLISYGDGDVNLAAMKAINIRVHGSPTAASMNGKEFTVIAAQDGAAAGEIVTLDQTLDIIEESGVPVLIDFYVTDNNTNGKADVTLVAEEVLPVDLKKHPNVDGSRNREQVAAMLPQTTPSNSGQTNIVNALQTLTNNEVNASFTSVHPEPFSSFLTVNLEQADEIMNTVLRRNMVAYSDANLTSFNVNYIEGVDAKGQTNIWIDGSQTDGDVGNKRDLGNFKYRLQSLVIGSTLHHTSNWSVGAFFGTNQQELDEHDSANSDISSNGVHVGIFGDYKWPSRYRLDGLLGHGQSETMSQRVTQMGNVSETADASYDSTMTFLSVRVSRSLFDQGADVVPFLGVSYIRIKQDAFLESNAETLGLSVDEAEASSSIFSAGVSLHRNSTGFSGLNVTGLIRYDHDFNAHSDDEHDIKASFIHTPENAQTFSGQNRGGNILNLGLSGQYNFGKNISLGFGLTYALSESGEESGIGLKGGWNF